MSRLADIVSQCIEATERPGRSFRVHEAVEYGVPLVMKDKESILFLVREGLGGRIVRSLTRQTNRRLRQEDDEPAERGGMDLATTRTRRVQGELFGLREAYSLDEANKEIKKTEYLTQPEFLGLIRIRKEQIKADRKHLGLLENTYRKLAMFWENDPEMTYAEVCEIYQRQKGGAA